jgi:hypothetical protein
VSLLSGIIILIAVIGILARRLLWRQMRAVSAKPTRMLAPAELAYLMRDGDMPHTLIVMSVDLVHRQIKSADQDQVLPLRSYEKQVWVSVKDFLAQLAQQKAGHLIPVGDIKNPMKWAVRASALKKFVGETLRSFLKDLIEDPRHIKKYFSPTGIARLAFYFYTSSVRTSVQRELRQELLQDGFLVAEERRKRSAAGVALLIPLMVAATLVNAYYWMQAQFVLVPVTMVAGLINAGVLRLLFELPGFIPTFDEFAKVASELNRGGARLAVVRTILKTTRGILALLIFLVGCILLGVEAILFQLSYHTNAIPLVVAQTILGFSMVACALDCHSLSLRDHATAAGEHELKETRDEVSRLRPLDTFRQTFADPGYDPTLSHLVAVYGIETLWLLS